jgi:hypothetical protein
LWTLFSTNLIFQQRTLFAILWTLFSTNLIFQQRKLFAILHIALALKFRTTAISQPLQTHQCAWWSTVRIHCIALISTHIAKACKMS